MRDSKCEWMFKILFSLASESGIQAENMPELMEVILALNTDSTHRQKSSKGPCAGPKVAEERARHRRGHAYSAETAKPRI
jgi:hypothetical protein